MCGTKGAENAAAANQTAFTNNLLTQAKTVFGDDNGVFNAMKNAYSQLLAAGPSQQGFSAAQKSAMNSAAITNSANQARFINARLGNQQASFGGGGIPVGASGSNATASAEVNEALANQTATALNTIEQADWAQGNKNWLAAGEGLRSAPSVFGNMSGFNAAAQTGLDRNMANAQAKDAASNWWVKPVTGLVTGGLSALTGGLSNFATSGFGNLSGDSSLSENVGNFFKGGMSGGGTMPGGSPGATPDMSAFTPSGNQVG